MTSSQAIESRGMGEEDSMLRRAIDLIRSLISVSYNIRVFSGKWKIIRIKLEELNSGLKAAENCQATTNSNTSLLNLVQTFLQTLSRCHDLAGRCVNISYGGKLLMQSDLDLACSKLDDHIRCLSGVYAANGFSIVVSRPGRNASRDDLRFYVGDLVTRMKIGDSDMKRQALVSLCEIVLDSDKSARIVMENNEIVYLLPNFLDSPEIQIQDESAKVTSVISGFDSYKSLLVGAGIIPPLIRLLEGGSREGKECAIKTLLKLTENSDNAWCVSAHGGVTALLSICCSDDKDNSSLISNAGGVLRNLVGVEEIKRFMVEEGAIPAFIKLIKASNESTQISSMEFLQTMAYGDEILGQTIVTQGGVIAMISVLDLDSSSYKAREAALKSVESLCFGSLKCFQLLVSYGFVDRLLYLVRNRDDSPMQELAFKVAVRLCGTSEEAQKVMGDAGFIPEFVRFLEAKSYEIRFMAVEAISAMVAIPKNKKRFLQEERNVGLILQMVGEDSKERSNEEVKSLLSILLSVCTCKSVRRRILSSGSMKSIEKLGESGVHDAKKIVRKVSSNKFHSMVSRILHFDG